MDRSSFLKSLFMVVAAPKMLAELHPLKADKLVEFEGFPGIVPYIENMQPAEYHFVHDLNFADLSALFRPDAFIPEDKIKNP